MPISISQTVTGNEVYSSPFVGKVEHFVHVQVDVSALTNTQVDERGYLKTGVVLTLAGLTPAAPAAGAVSTEKVGVMHEAVKIHTNNTTLAAVTTDPFVALGVIGVLNRDVMEDQLGRALTAAEVAALDGAGSRLVLTLT